MRCKAEYSASLLQFSVSHDPSEIILICWFGAYGTSLIIISVENGCADEYFYGNHDTFFQESSKKLLEIKYFTYSMLNKSIHFF